MIPDPGCTIHNLAGTCRRDSVSKCTGFIIIARRYFIFNFRYNYPLSASNKTAGSPDTNCVNNPDRRLNRAGHYQQYR